MALPTSRTEFKNFCMRKLGFPVIRVELDEMQVEDRIDEALAFYYDYHFDGSDKVYLHHQVTANNKAGAVYSLTLNAGGTGYSNTDTVVITANGSGSNATANLVTNSTGGIITVNLLTNGENYTNIPTVSITTSGGSGANVTAETGGWIPVPENVIGIYDIFDMGGGFNSGNMFSLTYQFFLNEMYSLATAQITGYYMAMQHLKLLEEVLVGKQPLRYNRHRNRLYIDMNWDRFTEGMYIVAHGYAITDPETYRDVWKDRWLLRYATALMKVNWGENLTKYAGGIMAGGVQFNAERILNDGLAEKEKLEEEIFLMNPLQDFIG